MTLRYMRRYICNICVQFLYTVTDTPTMNWDGARMMGLRATSCELRARSDEARNSETTKENEDRDKDQGDKNENTRLMCQ